jgi:hypothetical protein
MSDRNLESARKLQWTKAAECVRILAARTVPVAVWYPVDTDNRPKRLLEQSGMTGIEAVWGDFAKPASQNMKGAGRLPDGGADRDMAAFAENLLQFAIGMGWTVQRRVPRNGEAVVEPFTLDAVED